VKSAGFKGVCRSSEESKEKSFSLQIILLFTMSFPSWAVVTICCAFAFIMGSCIAVVGHTLNEKYRRAPLDEIQHDDISTC